MHRIPPASLAALLAVPAIAIALATPAAALPAAATAVVPTMTTVHPGASIQAAIDAAPVGGVVAVAAGHYAESLTITRSVTLVGRGRVLISPPAAAPDNACTLDPDADGSFPGICVVGQLADPTEETSPITTPVDGVHLAGIGLRGFTGSAVEIYGGAHVTLDSIAAIGNPGGGVFAARSTDVRIDRLTATGNGARGVDIHEDVTGFVVRRSVLTGNHGEGVFVGDSSDGLIAHNRISGNCTGVLVVDLALPGDTGVRDIRIGLNDVSANDALCPADSEGQPAESGNGIVLVGARDSIVAGNRVRGNAAPKPVDLSFGGLALLSAHPFTGGSAPSGDLITHNVVTGNAPMDLAYDGSGAGNTVRGNVCVRSTTIGACVARR